jgi:ribonuclease HII
MLPDFAFETAARRRGLTVAGVDEAGRGPLAGPVVAAAVILDPARIPPGLDDSKKLSRRAREALAGLLLAMAEVSVGEASVEEIDALNILRASHLAMTRALSGLNAAPGFALIDGNLVPRGCPVPAEAVVKGDARCLSIAAASVVAKVTRDRVMVDLAQQFPGYGWERNMGYPSPGHLAALKSLGPTPFHRRSFAPVHKVL